MRHTRHIMKRSCTRGIYVVAVGALLWLATSSSGQSFGLQLPTSEFGLSAFLHPTLFAPSLVEQQAELSAITERVVQYISPVIIRSAPVLPSPRNNFIDEHIFSRIESARIEPAPFSSDTEFFRRVKLDLTGRIPEPNQIIDFVNDTSPAKRNTLIDELISSSEFTDKWTMFFGGLFKLNGPATNVNRFTQGRDAFYLYLKDSIFQNKPYDILVQEMITATGDNHSSGAANFPVGGIVPMGPLQDTYDGQAVQVASMFLGIQVVDCLLCHDGVGHLEEVNLWGYRQTRLNMWGLSSFFAQTQIRRERLSTQPRLIRYNVTDNTNPRLAYRLNTTDGNRSIRSAVDGVSVVVPKYPFTLSSIDTGEVAEDENRREALADYITGDIQFARAIVNYIWEELMVEAFVTPSNAFDLDRLDPNNPPPEPWTIQPTNPELLEAMAEWLGQNNFDLRQLIALITKSRTYQLSAAYPTEWLPEYVPYYARKFARRLDAEEIHDAVMSATGVGANYPIRARTGTVLGPFQWAMQLPDTREPLTNRRVGLFLDSLGRGDRDQTTRSSDSSALQALNLMNHSFVMDRIDADIPTGSIAETLSATLDPVEIIRQMYLHTLSRFPSDEEIALLLPMMVQLGAEAGAESLQWVLLNKLDFVFNY